MHTYTAYPMYIYQAHALQPSTAQMILNRGTTQLYYHLNNPYLPCTDSIMTLNEHAKATHDLQCKNTTA